MFSCIYLNFLPVEILKFKQLFSETFFSSLSLFLILVRKAGKTKQKLQANVIWSNANVGSVTASLPGGVTVEVSVLHATGNDLETNNGAVEALVLPVHSSCVYM